MPSILLINDNKIVSRLLQLSSQKQNYTLEEINDYTPSGGAYNVVFIDSEKYDEDTWDALKSTLTYDRLGFIGDKTNPKPEGFDLLLEKPFLPTDFVNLMDENFRVMTPEEAGNDLDEMEEIGQEDDELDLDNLEELDMETELEPMDELDELDLSLDEELVEPTTTLTTGIATGAAVGEASELSELMGEIDNMEEEPVMEEMDLDALDDETEEDVEEEPVMEEIEEPILEEEALIEDDLALDLEEEVAETVVNEEMVKESLEEVEAEMAVEAIEEAVEEKIEANTVVAVTATATTAVTAAIASDKDEEVVEELEESLNILDGVEAIEQEDDYLKENDHVVEDLADEFDSLNADEVKQLMEGSPEDEILSEEFETVGEEKVVEANDLEEMITRAVAKAITKEMLQEALNDMEISVSLKTKKSDNS